MKHCLDPYPRYRRGEASGRDQITRADPLQRVACGRCAACIGNRKQNWTGKLVAESLTSASMAFVTLTYKNDAEGNAPAEFNYRHVQTLLKKLRDDADTIKRENRIRFFCVGERGDKFGRRHWHVLFFFSKETFWERPVEGQLWEHWPHGWTSIEMLKTGPAFDMERLVKKVRYCVQYCLKGAGAADGERARMSLKPALGAEFLLDHAATLATAGLALTGKYNLPGIRWDIGHKAGQSQSFEITPGLRDKYILAYRAAWELKYGERDFPNSSYQLAFDKLVIHRRKSQTPKFSWRFDGHGTIEVLKPRERSSWLAVRWFVCSSALVGLGVRTDGSCCLFFDEIGQELPRHFDLWDWLGDMFRPSKIVEMNDWLETTLAEAGLERGGNYEFTASVEKEERGCANALSVDDKSVLGETAVALRAKFGTVSGGGSIYSRSRVALAQAREAGKPAIVRRGEAPF